MDAYNTQRANGPYTGDYIAAPNATQYNAYNQAADFAQGYGGLPGQVVAAGQPLLAGGFNTGMGAAGALYNYGSTDQTQNNINTANAYANNPYIDQAVNAATRDARGMAEKNSANLYRNAASSGNLNSDRAALIQGEIDSSLAENAQNISATMRNNAFNTGLSTALTQSQQGLGALSNSGSLGTTLGTTGAGLMSQGITDQQNLSKLYESAGSGLNDLSQSILNNQLARYQGRIADTWSPVQNLYGIAGANNWGQTQNTQGTTVSLAPQANQPSPGALSYLGAGLGMAGSVAGLGMGGGATLGGMAIGGLLGYPSSTGSRFN